MVNSVWHSNRLGLLLLLWLTLFAPSFRGPYSYALSSSSLLLLRFAFFCLFFFWLICLFVCVGWSCWGQNRISEEDRTDVKDSDRERIEGRPWKTIVTDRRWLAIDKRKITNCCFWVTVNNNYKFTPYWIVSRIDFDNPLHTLKNFSQWTVSRMFRVDCKGNYSLFLEKKSGRQSYIKLWENTHQVG